MKILSVSLQNFASYEKLDFDFEKNQGLTLVQGATGSGKSTLMDAIPWILFGKTAKGGTVDEVLSWPGNEKCVGSADIELNGKVVTVLRTRGDKDNSLCWFENASEKAIMGSTLVDTQKLLNARLCFNFELYLSGAYYHEFSQTASFFTAPAKQRRVLCEQIVDLSLAKNLQVKTAEYRKNKQKSFSPIVDKIKEAEYQVKHLSTINATALQNQLKWATKQKNLIVELETQIVNFEDNRTKVITKVCPTCKTTLERAHEVHDDRENPYLKTLVRLETEENPYLEQDVTKELVSLNTHLQLLKDEKLVVASELEEAELLEQVISDFRTVSIENAIGQVEDSTNQLLNDHFTAELRITLTPENNDSLEVGITKDGNACSYTQLSKGQRQLLKLCFSVSIMKTVQNSSGLHFNQLFMDEALDGLSEELKLKSYGLLEKLALDYNSVYVIEHSSELKNKFLNVLSVELVNGNSVIYD